MKIGVNLPDVSELQALGAGGLAAGARRAEQLGFESVWMRGRRTDVLMAGSPQAVAERFAAYAQAGVERLVVAPTGGRWLSLRRIAEAIAALDADRPERSGRLREEKTEIDLHKGASHEEGASNPVR